MRVYGNNINFDALDDTTEDDTVNNNVTRGDSAPVTSVEDKIEIARLKAELEKEIALKNGVQEENQYIKNLLEEEKTERRKANNLLEDMRTKEEKSEKWENTLKALENRIANQEQTTKEQRLLAEKRLRIAKKLKQDLELEKSKSFWQRLFG